MLFGSSTRDRQAWRYISADVQRITLNASCITISGGRTEQFIIIAGFLPRHWLYEWFSQFHSCGTYSVLPQSPSIIHQVHQSWQLVPNPQSGDITWHGTQFMLVCSMAYVKAQMREDGIGLQYQGEKYSEETQTLRAACSKAEPKEFAPLQTPFPGAQDGQNLISWRWSWPSPTNPVWWVSMHTISSYHGNRPTNKQTHKHTQRQERSQYTALLSLACSVISGN